MVYQMDRLGNPDINPKPGTMDGIRRNDEIHVYLSRFFDNDAVSFCPGVVGKQLAAGLKTLNERLRPLYDAYRIPKGFPNRVSIGAACLTRGGMSKEDDWAVTEADFGSWVPRDCDKYTAPARWALENKARPSQHIETWKVDATRMSKMFSLLYGAEWLDERLLSIERLRTLHVETPHIYTIAFARDAWGASNHRWGQELRDLANTLRLRAEVESDQLSNNLRR